MDRDRPLTTLTPQRTGWQPDWPLRVWWLPIAMVVVSAIVAEQTSEIDYATGDRVLTGPGWAMICFTALLVGVLTYAFSEARPRRRLIFACIGVGVGFLFAWGIAAATLGLLTPRGE